MTVLNTSLNQISGPVKTGAADTASLASSELLEEQIQEKEKWQRAIDKCIKWGESPNEIDEDDWESPSAEAASRAGMLLSSLRGNNSHLPTRTIPSGEGGIVLALIEGKNSMVYEVGSDGTIEYRQFENSKLTMRTEILL